MEIPADDRRLKAAGWHVMVYGSSLATIHQINEDGKPDQRIACRVAMKDGQLMFLPERSAAQRTVLARMGLGPRQ